MWMVTALDVWHSRRAKTCKTMQSSSEVPPRTAQKSKYKKMNLRFIPNDVNQDPQLDQTAHHSHSPVLHQYLPRGLVLKEEVRDGVGDLAFHLLSSADPQRGGSISSP